LFTTIEIFRLVFWIDYSSTKSNYIISGIKNWESNPISKE